jgi:hypothetical protein
MARIFSVWASIPRCTLRHCHRHTVLKSGTRQFRPSRRNRLSTMPRLWRRARLNRHLMLKQNGMAASEKILLRLRLPLAGAHHGMSLSSQIFREDPRALNAALYVAQLVIL